MPLDPSAEKLRELLAASGAPAIGSLSIVQARANALQGLLQIALDPPEGVDAADFVIGERSENFAVRLYRPSHAHGQLPLVFFFHGGGWALCDLESHDHLCRHIAAAADCAVLAVDYRLAPEHPFPAAIDDAAEAVRWALDQTERLGIDPERLALFGDSAGGNLAAVLGLNSGRDGLPHFSLQILVYPVCNVSARSESYERNGAGYMLPRESMEYFIASYVQDAAQLADPRVSPLLAPDLSASPATIIYTAEYDVLHDEGAAMADALKAAKVPVEHRDIAGQMHGFLTAGRLLPIASDVIEQCASDLIRAFSQSRDQSIQ